MTMFSYIMLLRTQVQLEEHQHRQLRALGVRSGLGLAAQVRAAVDDYLARHGGADEPLETVLGKFRRAENTKGLKPHDRDYVENLR